MNKVSVIIPSYNCAEYVANAAESILKQTSGDVEVVIVDDGSRDQTKSVCTALMQAYPEKVQYIYQENRGVSAARNTGIEHAHGEYISFLDADDAFGPLFFEKGFELLERENLDFVIPKNFCHKIISPDGSVRFESKSRDTWPAAAELLYSELCKHFVGSVGLLAKRHCFETIRFDPLLAGGEDHDVWLQLLEKGYKAGLVETEEPQFFYMIRQGSAMNAPSVKGRRKYLAGLYRVLRKHKSYALRRDPALRDVFADKSWRIGLELLRNKKSDWLGFRALWTSQCLRFSPEKLGGLLKSFKGRLERGAC